MKKFVILLSVFFSMSFADAVPAPTESCSGDIADYIIRKRDLVKQFKDCNEKLKNYTISVFNIKVKEGETGREEYDKCLDEYGDSVKVFAECFNKQFPEQTPFSIEEGLGFNYYWQDFNAVLSYIASYAQVQEIMKNMPVLDAYNNLTAEAPFHYISQEDMEQLLAEAQASRENKDILRLYFQYLKAKNDFKYRCQIKPAFVCDTSWLGEFKADFLKKYPETQYREFVETQMPSFADQTEEEKKLAKADNEKVEQKLRERSIAEQKAARDVWVALSGMAMFGIPVTSTEGFDDNFDVSNMLTFGFKASWRSVVFQYQYFLSLGDNNKGGSVSEKGYTLMGGLMLGPKKIFTLDVLFGLSYIDTYPNDKDMRAANLDDESWTVAFQGTYYFPISDSWDITAHLQASMNFVENYCRDSFWKEDKYGSYECEDPYRNADNDKYWDDMQWTFSAGIGVRFWKPRY
jgi:hypothetical protein